MGELIQPSPAILVLEEQRLGYFGLSLSNFSTAGIPEIVGNVEVAGALYTFPSLEAITNWAAMRAGAVWVKLTPQLDATIDAVWTDVAPSWSGEKQGWYSPTLGEENQRYVFSATKVDASNVTSKQALYDMPLNAHLESLETDISGIETDISGINSLLSNKLNGNGMGPRTYVASTSTSTIVLPAGTYILKMRATTSADAVSLQLQDSGGTWRTIASTDNDPSQWFFVISDGTRARLVPSSGTFEYTYFRFF